MIKLTQTEQQAKHEGRIKHRDAYVAPDRIAAMYPASDGTVLHIAGQLSILRVEEHVTVIERLIAASREDVRPAARPANPDQAYDDAAAELDAIAAGLPPELRGPWWRDLTELVRDRACEATAVELELPDPEEPEDRKMCAACGARFWRGEACVCAPATAERDPAPAVLVPLPADATPEGHGRLRIEFEVYRDDGATLPKAREIGNGITEGLPSEWYEDQDGEEFYLGDSSWTATWLGQPS